MDGALYIGEDLNNTALLHNHSYSSRECFYPCIDHHLVVRTLNLTCLLARVIAIKH